MNKKTGIFILLCSIFTLIFCQEVYAKEQFYEGEYISSMWVNKEKGGKIRYQQARFLRRSSDHQFSYCIEPWEEISNSAEYHDIIDINQINDQVLETMSLISYYGYGYPGHTDMKWYYITQIMIWRVADPSANFYFTNKLNGTKITSYDKEIEQIQQLVQEHNKKPNFNLDKLELLLGEEITITDSNQILSKYQINPNDSILVKKEENKVTLKAIKEQNTELFLERKDTQYTIPVIVYRSTTNQNLMTVGSYKSIQMKLPIYVDSGTIEIDKIDHDTQSKTPSGEGSLIGSIFEIYNSKNELIKQITLDSSLHAIISNLAVDTYTIKEIKAGNGYQRNEKVQQIMIARGQKNHKIVFENEVIKKNIVIEKLYGQKYQWIGEANIQFEIKDNKGNIQTITTNTMGIAEISLSFGSYTISQKNTTPHYKKIEDFIITISEGEDPLYFQKYNHEITGNAIILKVDQYDQIIYNPAYFKLQNLDTGEWFDTIYQTNGGKIIIENLSCGSYKLVEVTAPEGYEQTTEEFFFTITDEKTEVNLKIKNHKKRMDVSVPDTEIQELSTLSIQNKMIRIHILERKLFYDKKRNDASTSRFYFV